MQTPIRDQYLLNELTTATPQRLHLMLIEAALRFARRAEEQRQAAQHEQAGESLIRAQEIVSEMLASLKAEVAPELVTKVAAIYSFIYRALIAAHLEHDSARLADAARILELERETWRQVCGQLVTAVVADAPAPMAVPVPHVAPAPATMPATGFSLEA